jgi:hypothetical protein
LARSDFLELCAERWPDKLARLRGGFYKIKDKSGSEVPFVMNEDQERFIEERHGLDIVLKARQKGFTTVIQLDMLDDCLFRPNTAAGVIAHNLTDAEAFFADKIKFAYDNLPDEFKEAVSAASDTVRSLKFSNGSSIRVGTSLRSGTLQRLHVSEYGKLCAKYPEKAREVKSGAFNTVATGQRITVESTAEGHAGHFYEMTKLAQDKQKLETPLTALDFKFHFAPWWTSPEYALSEDVCEPRDLTDYFTELESKGIILTRQQRAWYVKKAEEQGDDMKREYPSTPEEAFEASVEGAYFASQMTKMRKEKRICKIPILDMPVDTSWDLGVNDSTAITFWQTVGMERRAIDYYENSGEGWAHYAKVLSERGYNYRRHYGPHDIAARMMGLVAETRQQKAEEAGIKPWDVVGCIPDEITGIDASRSFLAQVYIDEERCARLIQCLDNYRKEWDDRLGVFKDRARHDEFSHGYKSLETYAVGCPVSAMPRNPAIDDKMRQAYAARMKAVH